MKLTLKFLRPIVLESETWILPESALGNEQLNKICFENLLKDQFSEKIRDFCEDALYDLFSERIAEISFVPKARYSLQESWDILEEAELAKAKELAEECHVIYVFTEDNGKDLFKADLDMDTILRLQVEERIISEQSNIDAGSAMIRGMKQYIKLGSWHYDWVINGESTKPVMWFGLEGEKPEEGWILNMEDDPEEVKSWKDFWFSADWETRVPDEEGTLDYWMGMECGDYLPSLEDVLKSCPIEVSEQDDYDSLTKKITEICQ